VRAAPAHAFTIAVPLKSSTRTSSCCEILHSTWTQLSRIYGTEQDMLIFKDGSPTYLL
jgi:hypothetical protein